MSTCFDDVVEDITRFGKKIPADKYQSKGNYPIIDQGQQFIAGYTDDNQGLLADTPVIIFGDHTRILKYVDFPFFLGAEGVKVLKVKNSSFLTKFIYYSLCDAKIPDTGYNRHFKWLKQEKFKECFLEEQQQIIDNLDKVNALIEKRNQQLGKLDLLVKSKFYEMFGNLEENVKGWTVDCLGEYTTLLTDFSANGSYELLDSNVIMYDEPNYAIMVRTVDLESGNLNNGVKYIDKKAYELLSKSKLFGGELIMNKIGSAGKVYIMPTIDMPASLGRNAFIFKFDSRINMTYLFELLTSCYGTKEIQQYVRGAVTKTITKESARKIRILVPPIELQNEFAAFVKQTEKAKNKIKQSLEKLQTLKKALMQKYFG